ncbi:MAG: phosphoribosyl-ATP diphosphatase [Myxococcota bacterium]
MIIPSIDILGGRAVQLRGGDPEALEVDAGDPLEVARRYSVAGPLAVIDLDAALGRGENKEVIKALCAAYRCRVGGGLRSVESAKEMLDAGAESVILGTAARPEILEQLPRERTMAAVDARHETVVVEGWVKSTGDRLLDRVRTLAPYVGGFLVTFVEREGRLEGTDLELASQVVDSAKSATVTIAGGVSTPAEVAALDRLGADAQVGMALYTGRLRLSEAIWACLESSSSTPEGPDPDTWIPTVVVDERGTALGLAYSTRSSLDDAVTHLRGSYYSRSRGELWVKGRTSGATQVLLQVDLDCDRDALRFMVRQTDGFCHRNTRTCWGDDPGLGALERRLRARVLGDAPPGSYTARLIHEDGLLAAKLQEEALELARAETSTEASHETADVLYFALVQLLRVGGRLEDVEAELDRRARKVSRRPGDRKPSPRQ